MLKKKEKQKLIRLLEWIDEYPGFWQVICEPNGENRTPDELRVIINSLQRAGLYEMILLTLEINKDKTYVQSMMESITNKSLQKMIKRDEWDEVFTNMMKELE